MNEDNLSIVDIDNIIEAGEKLAIKLKVMQESSQIKKINRWLDNQDVCTLFHLTVKQLENLRSRGKITYHKLGRKIYYREEDIADYLLKCKNDAR